MGDQEVNSMEIVKNITKAQFQILNPKDTKWILSKAIVEATSLRPGPVWVEIPIDVQGQKVVYRNLIDKSYTKNSYLKSVKASQLNIIINELSKAKKPVIFVSARVHPGEVPGSHIMKGLLDFLTPGKN